MVGAYQKNADLWKKIQTTFNHEAVDKNNLGHRTIKSLECRWDKISPACTIYGSCLTAVETRVINKVLLLFKLKDPKHLEFKFTHCWEILKNHPKWPQLESNRQVGDSPDEHGTPVSQVTDLNVETRDEIRPGAEGRGSRRNATKVKRKIANEKNPMWDEMMAGNSKTHALLEKQQFDFNRANQARMDMDKEKSDRK
ncbi:hypothetical protein FRX31_019692 [Thalictrum thalictroides]|uniref:No apical meristem-associated C-terminal domain-containing protein n=1 Tax=Thalictrum thalictroides TaxID=46969 RepID=A0A7J6W2F5_THATH|nr:hypothetical protein FRX31_019692 [Thalictrum thalictroides]